MNCKTLHKDRLEKFIKDTFKSKEGEKLEIRWMDTWEDHYRLNFWKVRNDGCSISNSYISRSILIRVNNTPDGFIEKEL